MVVYLRVVASGELAKHFGDGAEGANGVDIAAIAVDPVVNERGVIGVKCVERLSINHFFFLFEKQAAGSGEERRGAGTFLFLPRRVLAFGSTPNGPAE
jgi:hypothetical protein